MSRTKKSVNYAFIDSQNLNLGLKNKIVNEAGKVLHSGWKLDFAKFRKYLKDSLKVEKAYLCIGLKPGNEELYKQLQESGYICVFKPTLHQNGIIKGNCDAELVLHTMIEYNNYHRAVIVSGDGDFHCLIQYLTEKSKLDHLIIPNKYRYSSLLSKFSKHHIYINKLRKKLEQKENPT